MKKIIISILIFLFAFSVLAKTDEIPASGLTPDSSFYFLKVWKESIQTFFTFGAENKAKQYLHLSEVRLAEYQKMVEKGKTEIAEKTLKKYEKQLNNALEKAEGLKNKGKDIKDLSQKIEETVAKHLEVLQENLQKVPEQAKKGIENAIENSSEAIKKVSGRKICVEEGKMCGGIAGILCCSGLKCQLQGYYPDASGTCVKEEKKDETADWKTYRNEEYGFEVKYPPDAILIINDYNANPELGLEIIFSDSSNIENLPDAAEEKLLILLTALDFKYTNHKNFEDFRQAGQKMLKQCLEGKFAQKSCKFQDTTVLGMPAILHNLGESRFGQELTFSNNKFIYSISGGQLKNGLNIDQILSTFKFISQ